MRAQFTLLLTLFALGAVACESTGAPGGTLRDGGAIASTDGGAQGRDGGVDAGAAPSDAGASSPDAGTPGDAGSPQPDGGGGAVPDAGTASSLTSCTGVTFAEPCATCMRQNCSSESAACFGADWANRNFAGGKCEEYFNCVCPCGNNGGCLSGCPDPNADCISCLVAAKQCQVAQCVLFCGL
jgi:hypothetical protein